MRRVLLIAGLLTIAACSGANERLFDAAKAAIAAQLKDPESVQFRNLRSSQAPTGAELVCGEFNAKNSFGGYIGFKPFLWSDAGVLIEAGDDADKSITGAFILATCSGDQKAALRAVGVNG